MGELDPVRVPEGRRWLYWLMVAVVAFLVMIVTSSWWAGAEMWKIAVSGGLAGLSGSLIGRWVTAKLSGPKS